MQQTWVTWSGGLVCWALSGCGSFGLDPSGAVGGSSDALEVDPTEIDFGTVDPYDTPSSEEVTLTLVGDESVIITDIAFSERTSSAFELDVPFDTPEKLEEDRPFTVVFPSEDRRDRDGNGSSFSGTVEISYEVVKNSEPIVLEIEIKGVLDP